MATKGKITDLYDIEAIKAQQQQALGFVDEFVRKVNETKPVKVRLEGAEKTKDMLKGMTDLGLATKEYTKIIDNTATSQAKLNAMQSEAAKKQAEVRIEIQEQNKALKEEIQLEKAAEGSIAQKRIQLTQLQRAYDNLSAVDRGTEEGKALLKNIQDLDKELKQLEGSTGRFQRNVGNYSGALQTLEKALQEVKKKMDDFNASGNQDAAILETLQKEYGLLQTLLDTQSAGFKNATSEIRSNQQAILLLSQVYGEDSAVVQDLISKTGELKDTVDDMKNSIKARASDTKVFDGLIDAAQGLTGAYSIAQGAAALFGDENEELQKTFVKLQAVMTVLQGLQAIQNVLQKESQARQLITIGLQKLSTIQVNLNTAAESKNIIVRYAAIVAQRALNLAMTAGAGPLGIILTLVGLLAVTMTAFAATNTKVTKSMQDLNTELDINKSFMEAELNAIRNTNQEREAELKARFASDEEIRKANFEGQQRELKQLQDFEKQSQDAYNKAIQTQIDYHKKTALQQAETAVANTNFYSATYDAIKNFFGSSDKISKEALEAAKDIQKKYEDNNHEKLNKEAELRKKEFEDQRSAAVDEAQIRRSSLDLLISDINVRADALNRIAADETKSYAVRIKASGEYYQQQIELVRLQRKQALDNPELKPEERLKFINDAQNKETILLRDQAKARQDLLKQQAERERAARLAIYKAALDDTINADEAIYSNEKKSFDDRFNAAYDAYNKRRQQLRAQRNFDLENDKLTTKERMAIEAKYSTDVIQLTTDYGQRQLDLYKVNQEQITALIEKENGKRANIIAGKQADAITALNALFNSGKISTEKYNKDRADIEQKFSIESAQNEVRNAFAKVMATKDGTAERLEAERDLAEKTQALSDATTRKQLDNAQTLKEKQLELAQEGFSTITSIIDAQFDRQKNQVQAQIDDLDRKKEADIAAVNASVASVQDKEAKIAVINARAQAEKERLERRQRQLDVQKARFDKAATIAEIIAKTAQAVVSALASVPPNVPLSIAVGAIGAVQLAKAIATPIPQYAHGTDDAAGGPSVVGDGGKREAVITPDGRVLITPARPVVWDIPRHSVVLPDVKQLMDMMMERTHSNTFVATRYLPIEDGISAEISRQFEKHSHRIVEAILSKREHNFHWSNGELRHAVKNGMDHYRYIDDNINF